ncbi:hypothetical protein D0Z07_3693 [Hyphodiscus hymeniophilus]|uniref:ARM repeat-containing protein n=1 Tax=Hyphodiscus hymeniophilus TaxID=353542 RepID=A0A9P7AY71_9HELO|nr:hypothetical protein D0Z07_3693 [Hyphodiscus hymeniophilus]
MEGAGSRDISNYYLGGVMPSQNGQTQANQSEPYLNPSDPLVLLNKRRADLNAVSQEFAVNLRHPGQAALDLSAEEQWGMMKSIEDIFALEEDENVEMGEEGEEEQIVDLEDQENRTERLKGVLSTVAQLWWSDSQHMDLVAEKLADGSRDPKWRIPMGNSGVLNFFLEILSGHTLRHTLKIHVLRLIGNSCADTEPAQMQASNSFLSKELIELISSPRFNDSRAFLGYICKILDLLIAQPTEAEYAPENTAIVLLRISADREHPTDMDDFIALVNTAVEYLQHVKFQQALFAQGALVSTLSVLVDSYTRFDSHPSIGSPSTLLSPDQDDAKLLSEMRSKLNQVLSDVSALPEFKEAVPVVSPFSAALRRWLSSPQLQLQVCACIMLGNLARSDEACEEFVHTSQVHKPLITVLSNATDSQVLHAALGFLKNLALPLKNKEALAEAGIFEVLPRLWLLDTLQEIQFSSISLARQLIVGTFKNVRQIVKRLSDDEDSPAHMRSNLSLLIALFDRTDVEPIKMEISRLITAVCRVFNTYEGYAPEEMERIRKKFFTMHPDVGKPLGFMVSQTKWPVVRSEGWFVFAIMARHPEGAQCISDVMQDIAVFQPLVELLTGKTFLGDLPISSPSPEDSAIPPGSASVEGLPWLGSTPESAKSPGSEQEAEMARIDRENALVLISELLKNRGSEMALMRRTLFEALLKGGGDLLMSYRQTPPDSDVKLIPREEKLTAGLNLQEVAQQSSFELS